MYIEIDEESGFCFGVTTAIKKAEEELSRGEQLYCLGDIVHNGMEVERLHSQGLLTITHEELARLHDAKVLLRAHGEPPATYRIARDNNVEVIDATCPVVLQLQRRIKKQYAETPEAQIVIFGKNGHAEVLGLVGQTEGHAIVIEHLDDIARIDLTRDVYLYSQTTKNLDEYHSVIAYIAAHIAPSAKFHSFDTICRRVAGRMRSISAFASRHELIIFVSGEKSSNGKVLFSRCLAVNSGSHRVERPEQICPEWLSGVKSIGICGATSTPKWLMENCREHIIQLLGGTDEAPSA